MIRRPPGSTRTDTLFPYTTLFRSCPPLAAAASHKRSRNPSSMSGRPSRLPSPPRIFMKILNVVTPSSFTYFRSEEHTSELQSLMRISYAVFCLKKKNTHHDITTHHTYHDHHHIQNAIQTRNL